MPLRILPLTLIPLILYNALVVLATGPDVDQTLRGILFGIDMPSGGRWTFSWGDLLMLLTLVVLFIEVIKSTSSSTAVMVDHMLATLVFIVCLIEFLVVRKASTSIFFLITIAALIDVVAGFSISMRAARRSIGIGGM